MALIKCSECGKEFSDKAKACPNCACPVDEITNIKKKNNTNSKKIKEFNELTSLEKSSLRLCMKSQGSNSTAAIVLLALGGAFCLIGFFVGFCLLFLILGLCLYIAGCGIYFDNEKKYYYEHPESITKKLKEAENNKNLLKKLIPLLIIAFIGLFIGAVLIPIEEFTVLGIISAVVSALIYIACLYKLVTQSKK